MIIMVNDDNTFAVRAVMSAGREPVHGFSFEHVGRHPAAANMSSSRQRRTKSSSTSSRLSALRNALFNGGSRQQPPAPSHAVDTKTTPGQASSSGGFRSLFTRQADKSLQSPPAGDLWVDVDLRRPPASPSLDNLSVTSSEWMAATTAETDRRLPEVDRSAPDEQGSYGTC